MAWSGGNFTRANPTWATDASLGIGIEAGRHDAQDNDFTTGIDQCLNKTGQNSMTGDLNLGGYRAVNAAAGTAAAPAICAGNDVNTGIFGPAADTLAVATNGTERVRVDSTGRVGIGTIAPSATAHISGQVANSIGTGIDQGQLFLSDSDLNTSGLSLGYYYQAGVDEYARIQSRSAGGASNLVLQGGGGRVGIGVSNPTYTLDVQTNSNSIQAFRLINSNAGSAAIAQMILGNDQSVSAAAIVLNSNAATGSYNGASGLNVYQGLNAPLSFWTAATERIRINSVGQVGIGTTTPAYQLQLSTDSAAKPTTNTWTIASDERIKTNVQPYAKGLAEICQVNPITYDYNGKGGIPAGPGGVSILAQELQPVFPECVGSYKAKLNEDDEDETDILNYNGHAVTFALINAVKELNAKVEALEAKVENLEAVTAGL